MGVSLNGGTQQPWVFLLKVIILGCFGGTPIFWKHPYIYKISPGKDPKQFKQIQTETTGEPKKAATPTNTKAARSKVALRTPTVNCLGKKHIHNQNK